MLTKERNRIPTVMCNVTSMKMAAWFLWVDALSWNVGNEWL